MTTMTMTTTQPKVPTLPTQQPTEGPHEFGLRSFRFLLTEGLSAAWLDTPTLDLALAASNAVIGAPVMGDAARERLANLRRDMATTLERRKRDELAWQRAVTAAKNGKPNPSGGHTTAIRRPTPVQPPPSAARRL